MAEIIYVVIRRKYQHPDQIEAFFSNEGLAQTHRAKLAVGFFRETFVVEERVMDAEADVEPIYWAWTIVKGVHARDTNLFLQAQGDGVGRVLPEPTTQYTPANDTYGFSAYGWDEASAKARVQLMVSAWYAQHDAAF